MNLLGIPVSVPDLPVGCVLSFSPAYAFRPATGTPSGKRHYMCHGLNGSAATWDSEPFLSVVTGLNAAGDECVLLNLPIAQACPFTNGGWQYREQFNTMLNAVLNDVETNRGVAVKSIIGGISYGGLHAMLGQASNGRFCAWWAHMTVTRIDALGASGNPELAGIGDVVRFNPFYEVTPLAIKPGYITWGTADTRVDWTLTRALAVQLPSTVTKHEYAGLDHTTNAQGVSDILAFAGTL